MGISESRMRQIVREEAHRVLHEGTVDEMAYAGNLGIRQSPNEEGTSFFSDEVVLEPNRPGAEKFARSGRFKTLAEKHFANIPGNVWVAPLIGVSDDVYDSADGTSVIGAGREARDLADFWQSLRLAPGEPRAWADFLDSLEEDGVGLTPAHAEAVRSVWRELRKALGPGLALPLAEGGEDGAMKLSWSGKEAYADIELHRDGTQEWFWRDRRRDAYGGSTEPTRGALDTRLVDMISRFAIER